jgi:ring-1,2-phenylacetyl-CoA epoxidase subunit PaaC
VNALVEYLLRLGDDRLVLGHRLSEWCGHAPILEEDIALSNIALDLLGQAARFLALAGELEGRGRDADALAFSRGPTELRNVQLVEQPNGDFAQTIVRQVLFDTANVAVLEQLASSSHAGLGELAAQAAKETRYHVRHGRDWFLRLGDGGAESHARMQRALDALWVFTPELFEADAVDAELCRAGVAADLAPVRAAGHRELSALTAQATLRLPADPPFPATGGRHGVHTEHLDHLLSEMQCVARAHPGASW